jgi:hypothetical protein
MPAGDVRLSSLKIGDLDLTDYQTAGFGGANIYEDIFNPYGPVAEIRVVDHSDALGKNNINGAYNKDVEISMSPADQGGSSSGSGERKFKFKMFQNKNLDDLSKKAVGAGHFKQYDIRSVSPEMLNAQSNYIQKSYNGQTHAVVEDVLKNGFKTDKQVDIKSKTSGKRRIVVNNEHPLDVLHKMNSQHVSDTDKSSCFVCFQQAKDGEQKYVFSTFENLFQEKSSVKLKQRADLDFGNASEEDKQNSIMWFKAPDSFFTAPRALIKGNEQTFNLTTHQPCDVDPKDENEFKFLDQPIFKSGGSNMKKVPLNTVYDKANDKDKHTTATAKVKRAAFLAHLAQNSAELETYFNPEIHLGSVIELDIPKKANNSDGQGEKQFNGKVLVVAIRTKIKPTGQVPYATMILRVVKASYKEGGDGEA